MHLDRDEPHSSPDARTLPWHSAGARAFGNCRVSTGFAAKLAGAKHIESYLLRAMRGQVSPLAGRSPADVSRRSRMVSNAEASVETCPALVIHGTAADTAGATGGDRRTGAAIVRFSRTRQRRGRRAAGCDMCLRGDSHRTAPAQR